MSSIELIENRIKSIETVGCPKGFVQDEKIENVKEVLACLKKTMDEVNKKLFWGLILFAIISFLAGVNVMDSIVRQVITVLK